ncbi:archaeosortase A [Halobacteriales archaeon QS_8_69_26]|nr:MAG: archaeosortase A [Halobacteriales archaeon QS_8_69_26]
MTAPPGLLGPLDALAAHSDALAWAVVAAFALGVALEAAERTDAAVWTGAGAWVLFGVFWLSVFPEFALEMRSPIEGTLSLLAVPACLSTAYLLLSGRRSLLVLSRAVAFMGLIYLPVETVPVVRQVLIETVATQTEALMAVVGRHPEVGTGPDYGYRNAFTFVGPDGARRSTYIVTACTGIGSISIFGGLVASVRAPLARRARALAVAVGVVWVLNLCRNAFIAVAYGEQWFQQGVLVGFVTANVHPDPGYTSYFVADRVVAQTLSVVALVGVTWLVVREVPEVLAVLEEALYALTRRAFDLGATLGVGGSPTGDGPTPETGRDAGAGTGGSPSSDPTGDPTSGDPPGASRSSDPPADGPEREVSTESGGD